MTIRSCEKKSNPNNNKTGSVRMVLLENFGAESFHVRLKRSNGHNSEGLLLGKVASPVTIGISKFRKENHPERAKDK
jgi:hypothetical protein